jgi:ubiquitin C-terminal hydrolase
MKNEENLNTDANIEEESEVCDEDFEYKLVGVVVHMGQANAGHYISYINIERERDSS